MFKLFFTARPNPMIILTQFRRYTDLNKNIILATERPCPSGKTQYHPGEVDILNQHKAQKFTGGLPIVKQELDKRYKQSPY